MLFNIGQILSLNYLAESSHITAAEQIFWDKRELKSFLLASSSNKPRDKWAWKPR